MEQNRLYNSYFPVRTNNVINTLRTAGLYPAVNTPSFAINGQPAEGGFIGDGATLTVNGDNGVIYYTLDGSDPLLPDGSINPAALSISSGFTTAPVFPFESSGWRYLTGGIAQSSSDVVVGNASYDTSDWKHPGFSDESWTTGQGLLGGRTPTSVGTVDANTTIDIGPLGAGYPTLYFRKAFNVTNASEVTSLDLSIVRDDGVIVYLNGHEIYRENMKSGTVVYGDFAESHANENVTLMPTHTLAPGQLLEGTNVLSVEVHNRSVGSSDLGLDVALDLTRPAGETSIDLAESAAITARLKTGDSWSAPNTGTFLLERAANESNLAIAEINYHPREATLIEKNTASPLTIENRDQFEFVELLNIGNDPINLANASFSDGITFTLGLFVLEPGERALLVRDESAFLSRYGSSLADSIAGTFTGGLDNDGESLTLIDSGGTLIRSITYNDSGPWPSRPDGAGSSLEIIDPPGNANTPANWAPSVSFHGSPGTAGLISDKRVVINEVSSNSTSDFIEIYNTTSSPIEIGGWLLTDSKSIYRSFTLPETTLGGLEYHTIQASDYDAPLTIPVTNYTGASGASPTVVTSSNHGLATGDLVTINGYGGFSDFNASIEVTVINADSFAIDVLFLDNHPSKGMWQKGRSFGISGSNGDDLWLLETDAEGNPVAFVDHVEFAASAPDTTLGRWLDGMGYDTLVTMTHPTLGSTNSGPVLGPVFVSEVHYAPAGSTNHEFVELTNQGGSAIALEKWKLRGGLDFDFTIDHAIPANGSVVIVNFNPATETALATDFRNHFGIDGTVTLIGPAVDGPLDDTSGTVRLQMAGPAPEFGQITVDEVRYLVEAPWPSAAGGSSLNRNTSLAFGNFANSWNAAAPTPGSLPTTETYAAWASANGVGTGELDPDGDNFSNLLEFAMGTDPNSRDELPPLQVSGTTGTITFPSHLGRSGFTLEFQTSDDLDNWTTQPTSPGDVSGSIQTNEFVIDLSTDPKVFWRLRALAL